MRPDPVHHDEHSLQFHIDVKKQVGVSLWDALLQVGVDPLKYSCSVTQTYSAVQKNN